MAHPPEFDAHSALIEDYIRRLGLFGLLQEIKFVLREKIDQPSRLDHNEIQSSISKIDDLAKTIAEMQSERIRQANWRYLVSPIGCDSKDR